MEDCQISVTGKNPVFTIIAVICISQAAAGLDVLEPDYTVEIYASYSEPTINGPSGIGFDGIGNLYILQGSDGDIYVITPERQVSKLVSGLGTLGLGVAWGGGTDYGNYLYVIEYKSIGGGGRIINVNVDQGTISTFVSLLDPGPLAIDKTGNYAGYMYAGVSSYDRIYRLDTNGNITTFSAFPGSINGGGPGGITFDPGTSYGGLMYVTTNFHSNHPEVSGLFTLDTSGNVSRFTDDLIGGLHLAFDTIGSFERELFVVGKDEFVDFSIFHHIWRVNPKATATRFATSTSSINGGLAFGPDGAMYVAEFDDPNDTVIITRIRKIYVDDNGPGDPAPGIPGASVGEPGFSDPLENGSCDHPFDSIQKAINDVGDGATIIVLDGTYTGVGNCDIDPYGLEVTIKSENGAKNCTINCQDSARAFIFQTGENSNTIIDGFTIINGYSYQNGGAIFCNASSPTIKNCTITDCYAQWSGAAIWLQYNSNSLITACKINSNVCAVAGAITTYSSSPTVENCLLTDNRGYWSGAMTSTKSDSNPQIINCTIADNLAENGPGALECHQTGNFTVINSILWANTEDQIFEENGAVFVSYSDVQILDSNGLIADSNWPGTGNMNADPLFAAPYLDDYHLKSSAGRWTYTLETNGDFNNDGIVDELDLAIFMLFWLESNPADLNGDIVVNFLDYALFTAKWLNEGSDIDADFNGDGIVNRLDLDIFTRYWLQASFIQASIADLNGDKMVDFIDYAMFSANWRGPGNNVGGYTYIDTEISPCIDAGDPNSPYLLEPEPNGGRINMGAYGNTTQASKSTN